MTGRVEPRLRRSRSSAAILLKGVSKRFAITDRAHPSHFLAKTLQLLSGAGTRRPLWALQDVSLAVDPGEAVGVIGPNGAGKTTLLLIVAGLLAPTSGTVEVRGRVNPFFQLAAGLHPRFTVLENFSLCASLLGMPQRAFARHLPSIIEFSGLEGYLHARFGELSSGLAARVAFSVAVHAELDIILIDEALAMGDKSFQAKCRRAFEGFKREGKTLLVVSHEPDALARLCARIVYLKDGRVASCGEPRESIARYWHDICGTPASEAARRPVPPAAG
ncbi:MAG: ABC transporter ATP-binding protein, partial [Elusimicrobia bacterium]|nr:ABC transporter ATP-binding protein [Elusimicrobiota bacterium]